jgi:hypothetical protein
MTASHTTAQPTTVSVGAFTFEPDTGTIQGPAEFMRSADYRECIRSIETGTSVTFRGAYEYQMSQPAPSFGTALLVTVQTCYAGWHGMQTFNRMRGA